MPDRHLAASGGLLAASAPGYDVVRIGLAMYGIVPDGLTVGERHAATAAGLKPILSLRARPVRVTELAAGMGVSYGPTFITSRPSRIATLPLGYADGLPRSLSNKARSWYEGAGPGRRHRGHGRRDDRCHGRSGGSGERG